MSLANQICSSNFQCNQALGLICSNNTFCFCSDPSYYWNNLINNCSIEFKINLKIKKKLKRFDDNYLYFRQYCEIQISFETSFKSETSFRNFNQYEFNFYNTSIFLFKKTIKELLIEVESSIL